jgi:hypothetical protein
MKQLIQKLKSFFIKEKTTAENTFIKLKNFAEHEEETMKAKADRIISDVHEFEHKESMRWMALIHNCALMTFTFLAVLFFSKWFVFAFLLWDFTTFHNKKSNN